MESFFDAGLHEACHSEGHRCGSAICIKTALRQSAAFGSAVFENGLGQMNCIENLVTTSSKFGWGFDAVEELHQGKQGMVAIGGFGFHLMCVFDFVVFEVFKGWEARALLRHG